MANLNVELPELEEEDNSFSLSGKSINPERQQVKSLNPLRTYEEQEQELAASYSPSEEEQRLATQAQGLAPSEADGNSKLSAQILDIVGNTAERYAAAKGVPGAGKTLTTAQDALRAQQETREQLRKNLLAKIDAKKQEREEKRKGLYEKIGLEGRLVGEGREGIKFDQSQEDRARLDKPLSPQQQEMYKRLAAQRGVKIDLSTATQRDVGDIEKAIGLGLKPDAAAHRGREQKMPIPQVKLINLERKARGQQPLPEDGSVSYADVDAIEMSGAETRRTYGTLKSMDSEGAQDAQGWLAKQPEKTKVFVANTVKEFNKDRKIVDGAKQDTRLLETLVAEVEQGNAFAGQALKNRLPRIVGGEKGVLTDQDVTRLAGSQTYWETLKRFLEQKVASGTAITSRDLQEIRSTVEAIKANQGKDLAAAESRAMGVLRTGLGESAPASLLYGGMPQPSTSAPKGDTMAPKKRFIVDGQPRELTKEEFERLKASGAKITR